MSKHKKYYKDDKYDVVRGWGWHLLSKNDSIFNDEHFMKELQNTYYNNAVIGSSQQKHLDIVKNFGKIWKKLVPSNVEIPKNFYLTGSDANNSLYDLALQICQKKQPDYIIRSAEIISMDKIWGGGRGKIAGLGFMDPDESLDEFRIPAPITKKWNNNEEDKKLDKKEYDALNTIKKLVKKHDNIGGLLIEPIVGPYGVYFYRFDFMIKLRKICDKLKIPIISDEILTGGGRTGKFFAYEHYPNFEPDYITFGKGVLLAGLTRVNRKDYHRYPLPKTIVFGPTLYHYRDSLIRSTFVLTKIYDNELIKHAEKIGKYFIDKLRERAKLKKKNKIETNIRGMGLLIYVTDECCPYRIGTGMGRIMPELTITKEIIDYLTEK